MLKKDILLRFIVLCAASNSLLPIMAIFVREHRIEFSSEYKLLQSDSESEEIGTATVTEGHNNMSVTYLNCTGYDVLTCCWSYVNLPCSEFNNDPVVVETCGENCGIPCVDDSGDPDVGIIVEAEDNNSNVTKCYDHKPQVCCQFLARNSLCSETYFTGCRKSCSQC